MNTFKVNEIEVSEKTVFNRKKEPKVNRNLVFHSMGEESILELDSFRSMVKLKKVGRVLNSNIRDDAGIGPTVDISEKIY